MNEALNIHEDTVANTLSKAPQTLVVFNQFKTACVGCHFARFCTLAYVVASYQLDEKDFLNALSLSLKQKQPSERGE
jgi:hypothetical protein